MGRGIHGYGTAGDGDYGLSFKDARRAAEACSRDCLEVIALFRLRDTDEPSTRVVCGVVWTDLNGVSHWLGGCREDNLNLGHLLSALDDQRSATGHPVAAGTEAWEELKAEASRLRGVAS